MKIAQVAPLHESCPPRLYGGTERVVAYLTEELVRCGHDVTLFASGDSKTSAHLEPICARALRLDPSVLDPLIYHIVMFNRVAQLAARFDVIHFHTDYLHFGAMALRQVPTVTTLHGRLDLPDLPVVYAEFPQMPLISISDHQRNPLSWLNWCATVHHGLPRTLYKAGAGRGGYLAFIGRISPEKRLDTAIEIARRFGMPLRIAAKVDKVDRTYFEEVIRPLLGAPHAEFLGEISDAEKGRFLGDAAALLFPVDWPEPFGLAMIEAMANGTPVIAMRRGAVPEIVDSGVTGFIVDDLAGALDALPHALLLDRARVRQQFERRFSGERMARDYVAVYEELQRGTGRCRRKASRVDADDIVPAA
jgi:glycosyltransferase involved in cell wall biosynthesis